MTEMPYGTLENRKSLGLEGLGGHAKKKYKYKLGRCSHNDTLALWCVSEVSSHSSLALISSLATPSGFYGLLYRVG